MRSALIAVPALADSRSATEPTPQPTRRDRRRPPVIRTGSFHRELTRGANAYGAELTTPERGRWSARRPVADVIGRFSRMRLLRLARTAASRLLGDLVTVTARRQRLPLNEPSLVWLRPSTSGGNEPLWNNAAADPPRQDQGILRTEHGGELRRQRLCPHSRAPGGVERTRS